MSILFQFYSVLTTLFVSGCHGTNFVKLIFFFKRKKGKKFEQSQSIRTDNYLIGMFVIDGWGNWTLVFSPALTKSHSFQTENVLIIFF